jgi:hypothetical protein
LTKSRKKTKLKLQPVKQGIYLKNPSMFLANASQLVVVQEAKGMNKGTGTAKWHGGGQCLF